MTDISVLLIDDDEEIRLMLDSALTRQGFSVIAASGGNAALKLLKEQQFDVVVTDIMMEEGEGVETLLAIKKHDPALPVIGISGRPQYLEIMDRFGAYATRAKPLKIDDLCSLVREAAASGGC